MRTIVNSIILVALLGSCGEPPKENNIRRDEYRQHTIYVPTETSTCTVEQTETGATIECDDGSIAVIQHGENGSQGPEGPEGIPGPSPEIEVLEGLFSAFEEVCGQVILITVDNVFIGYENNTLTILQEGITYRGKQGCEYIIIDNIIQETT